jgi:hypothetical protein
MTSNHHPSDRCDLPLAPDAEHNLTTEEVRLLWSFIHGDIMNEPTRMRLRKRWGLCGRHAWGSAIAEIELWQSGAGERGGHQPFDAAVLYDDLLGTMVQALVNARKRTQRTKRKVLKGKGNCIICDDVHAPALPGMALTHGGFTESVLANEANSLLHTREWLLESAPVWRTAVCPECAVGAVATVADGPAEELLTEHSPAALCRLHLIDDGQVDDAVITAVLAQLLPLRVRVRALAGSMTQRGAASTAEVDASWVQAMGWFHGWGFPLAVVASVGAEVTSEG